MNWFLTTVYSFMSPLHWMLKSTLSWFSFSLSWTWSQEILFPSTLCRHDGSDAKNLKEVFQLQFGAGEGAGLEENLAAAQQQMQVMQQVIMMEMVIMMRMVILLVLSIVLLAMVVMERGIFYENSLRAASAELLWKVATQQSIAFFLRGP